MTKTRKNILFGKLLKAAIHNISTYEGKTSQFVEDELATSFGISYHSIQKYKTGNIPANPNFVRAIAIDAVKRGFMSKEWTERFLDTGIYPFADQLVNELFPNKVEKSLKVDKVRHNLPSPTYNKFIMRNDEFDKIINGLKQRSAIVLVASLGGMGKTSLAREVTSRCISKEFTSLPKFESAVWVSDANNPGNTNLSVVLDEVAQTLDYPGIIKLSFEEKIRQINDLLRRQKVLLVLDNFETIKDDALLNWLVSLPEPSKCIVTTREYFRAFRNNTYVIELGGMKTFEARQLLENKMKVLGLENLISQIEDFDPILDATGGNPKALEMSLGLIKYEGRSLKNILQILKDAKGVLFEDLFDRSWRLLNEEAKHILMTSSIFPEGTEKEVLSKVSNVDLLGTENAITKLKDLSLFSQKAESLLNEPLNYLHPLILAFSKSKLNAKQSFEQEIRKNWLEYYHELSSKVGFCWNDIEKLNLLDKEGVKEGVEIAINWASKNGDFYKVISISENVKYYYYVRGFWSSNINLLRANAAKIINDNQIEFDAIVYHINIASKQNNLAEVEKYLPRLKEILVDSDIEIHEKSVIDYRHSLALYHMFKGDYSEAMEQWDKNLSLNTLDIHQLNANRRWCAICHFQNGDSLKAKELLTALYENSKNSNFLRAEISAIIYLAKIDFKELEYEEGIKKVDKIYDSAKSIGDYTAMSELDYLKGEYYFKKMEFEKARKYLNDSINDFERLGKPGKVNQIKSILIKMN